MSELLAAPFYIYVGVFITCCTVFSCLGLLHSYIHAGDGLVRRPRHIHPSRSGVTVLFGSPHGRFRIGSRGTRVLGRERGTCWAIVSDGMFGSGARGELVSYMYVTERLVGGT